MNRHVYIGDPPKLMHIDEASEIYVQAVITEHSDKGEIPARVVALRSFTEDGRIIINAIVFHNDQSMCSHSFEFDESFEVNSLTESV